MIPTIEQYNEALKIVNAYESEEKRIYGIKTEAFREDLKEYFLNNPYYKITEFNLRERNIIPVKPYLEEMYNGEMNKDIQALCEKHNVKFSMVYWCYHK